MSSHEARFAACASDPIRDLRYVVAELRTRGEVGLADILEQAVSKIFVGVEPAGTRGAATSPDEPGYVAPSGFSPGGCAAPAHSSKLGPDRRDRGARFVPGASASSASDKTPNTGSSGPSSAACARGNEPIPSYGLNDDYPEMWEAAQEYDFAERLGGSSSKLAAEIDEAMRELWNARRYASENGETCPVHGQGDGTPSEDAE